MQSALSFINAIVVVATKICKLVCSALTPRLCCSSMVFVGAHTRVVCGASDIMRLRAAVLKAARH